MGRLRAAFICSVTCVTFVSCGMLWTEEQVVTYLAEGVVEKIPDSTADYGLRGTLKRLDWTASAVEGKYRFSKNLQYNSPLYLDSIIQFNCEIYSSGTADWSTVIGAILKRPWM